MNLFSAGSRFVCLHCHLPTPAYFINKRTKTIIQMTKVRLGCEAACSGQAMEWGDGQRAASACCFSLGSITPHLAGGSSSLPSSPQGSAVTTGLLGGAWKQRASQAVGLGTAAPRLPAALCHPLAQLRRRAAPADGRSVLGSSHPSESWGWGEGFVHWMALVGPTLFPPALSAP